MRNLEDVSQGINSQDRPEISSTRSIDRIPIAAPTPERAVDTAINILKFFQDQMDEDVYRSRIEAAWRAARGPQRWIFAGRNEAELMLALEEFVFESKVAASGTHNSEARRVTFIFSGMGPQWSGMGRNLAENLPGFANHLAEIDQVFIQQTGKSVLDQLAEHEGEDVLPTAIAQMGNFLIQAALYHLLMDEGITPDAVLGHSAGEVAAGYASGVYTLEQAVSIAVARGTLQSTLAGRGSMLAVGLGYEKALELIAETEEVSIAAVNDDSSVTLAGNTEEIEKLDEKLKEMQVFSKILRVEVPYHSPVMEEITGPIISKLSFLSPSEPKVDLYSSVLGHESKGIEWTSDYWAKNIRQPVLFAKAFKSALEDGNNCFIEISPHPVLAQSMKFLCSEESGISIHHTLSRRGDEYDVFLAQICELAIDGIGRPQKLGSAPLLRPVTSSQPLWEEDQLAMDQRCGMLAVDEMRLLGRRSPGVIPKYDLEISTTDFPWIEGHAVQSLGAIVPATLWAELMALAVTVGKDQPLMLVDLMIMQALPVTTNLSIIHSKVEGGVVKCFSRPVGKFTDWTLHALATIATQSELKQPSDARISTRKMPEPKGKAVEHDPMYEIFKIKGLEYAGPFKNLKDIVIGEEPEAWASVNLEDRFSEGLHAPWLLDAGLQLLIAAVKDWSELMYLPYRIGRINFLRPITEPGSYKIYANVQVATEADLIGAVYFYDAEGQLLVEIDEITCMRNVSDDVERSNYINRHSYTQRDFSPEELAEFMAQYEEESESEEEEAEEGRIEIERSDEAASGREPAEIATSDETKSEVEASEADVNRVADSDVTEDEEANELFEELDEYWVSSSEPDTSQLEKLFERPEIDLKTIDNEDEKIHLLWSLPNRSIRSDIMETVQLLQNVSKLESKSVILTLIAEASQHWVFGLRRSAANAYGLETRVVMRDETTSQAILEAVIGLVSEHEVVFKGDEPLFRRLEKTTGQMLKSLDDFQIADPDKPQGSTLYFDFPRGQLHSMVAIKEPLRAVVNGELCLKVTHVGVAWKDVGKILGTIGTALVHTYGGQFPGTGVAGTVIAAGPDAPFAVGDRIFGAIKRSFRLHAIVSEEEMVGFRKIPDHIDEATVVSHALPWMTTNAVFERSKGKPGEKVFIQSGAGALGSIMRLTLKQHGVEFVTSVGTEEKLAQLKEEDPDLEVILARGNEIPQALIEAGHNEFDWIIATLSGSSSSALLSLLSNRGQYYHLGKPFSIEESFLTNAFDGNKTFRLLDVDQLMARSPGWLNKVLDAYMVKLEDRSNVLPVTTYPIGELPHLMSEMAQGRTTGCLAVEMAGDYELPTVNGDYFKIQSNGCYLITGGYGAVGLLCAQWLVSRGARHLILTGSSGNPSDTAKGTIEILKASGAEIEIVKSDIGDREAVDELVHKMVDAGEKIRGVVHTAGLIADGPFDNIDEERIARSFGPKLEGANYLVSSFEDAGILLGLDFFILTSSISSVIGLTIQGTYAAANSGLDGVAEQLQAKGVNACAIQLGAVDQRGMASDEAVKRYFSTLGLSAINPRRLFGFMDLAVAATVPHFAISEMDWAKNGRAEPANSTSSVLGYIVQEAISRSGSGGLGDLLQLDRDSRTKVLSKMMIKIITEAIGVEDGYLTNESNFSSMGIDSLAIMEIQASVNETLNQELPLTRLFTQDATIGELSERISEYLEETADNQEKPDGDTESEVDNEMRAETETVTEAKAKAEAEAEAAEEEEVVV